MFIRPDYSADNLNGVAMNDKILLIILPLDDFFGKVTKHEGVLYIHACQIKLVVAKILCWLKVSCHPKRSLGLATISCLQCTVHYSVQYITVTLYQFCEV
jgi:hypothetical protein